MDTQTQSPVLQDYLHILGARKWVVIGVTVIAVAIGVAFSLLRTKVYEATATIKFDNQSTDISVVTPGVQVPADINQTQSAAANSRIVTRSDVVRAVRRRTGVKKSAQDLRDDISATVQQDSDLIAITASTGNPELSARLANTFARQTKRVVAADSQRAYARDAARLRAAGKAKSDDPATRAAYRAAVARLAVLSQVSNPVELTRLATVPTQPSSPKPVRDVLLALVVGLILGIAVAFLRHALDRRFNDRHQVESELGLPIIGYVRDETLGLSRAAMNGSGEIPSEQLEPFRIIRTNAAFMTPDREFSTVLVTSALPEEGKSTVASWYAYANAAAGRRTLLVDCDFRKPVLAPRFGLDPSPGLAEYLTRDAELDAIKRDVDVHGPPTGSGSLTVIPVRGEVYEPAEMLGSQRFQEFINQVTADYDLVIFDSAPLLPVSDTLQLVLEVDAVLLCVRVGRTTRQQAQAGKRALARLPARPTGVVVTGARRPEQDEYGYYQAYGYTSTGGG